MYDKLTHFGAVLSEGSWVRWWKQQQALSRQAWEGAHMPRFVSGFDNG